MITPLGRHDMGERGIAELAACNGLNWCRRLNDSIAGPAAVLGSNGLDHLPGLGDQIEHLLAIFTPMARRSPPQPGQLRKTARQRSVTSRPAQRADLVRGADAFEPAVTLTGTPR